MFNQQKISILSSKHEGCGVSKRPTAKQNTRSHSTREFRSLAQSGSLCWGTKITNYSCTF